MHTQNVPDYDVEHSEVLLYHVRLLEETGEAKEALAFLDVNAKSRAIVDRIAIMEHRGLLQLFIRTHGVSSNSQLGSCLSFGCLTPMRLGDTSSNKTRTRMLTTKAICRITALT